MKKSKRRGVALLEVVIALILLTGYIIFNTTLYYSTYTNVKNVQQYTIGTNLLIKTVEQVKAQSYEEISEMTDTFATALYEYNISVDVSTEQYNSIDYKVATVTISWGTDNVLTVNVLKYNPPVFIEV